ncbi:uncharacterized protein LOC109799539 [Cajanus cajan]|nr:uncharacterized protein LOC109799539 [Cajanus cajan]
MAEAPSSSSSLRESKVVKDHECDVDAAQKLMQLSEEEESNSIARSKRRRNKNEEKAEELSDIIMAKIQEIFGNDIEVFPTKKQRRYRSLVSIYMVTRPVNARVKA